MHMVVVMCVYVCVCVCVCVYVCVHVCVCVYVFHTCLSARDKKQVLKIAMQLSVT